MTDITIKLIVSYTIKIPQKEIRAELDRLTKQGAIENESLVQQVVMDLAKIKLEYDNITPEVVNVVAVK